MLFYTYESLVVSKIQKNIVAKMASSRFWNSVLVVRALDYQCMGSRYKTNIWLQV